jgi:hypothetical protein
LHGAHGLRINAKTPYGAGSAYLSGVERRVEL